VRGFFKYKKARERARVSKKRKKFFKKKVEKERKLVRFLVKGKEPRVEGNKLVFFFFCLNDRESART